MRKLVCVGISLVLGFVGTLALAAPGEYWEMTNKMEMEGMSMPGMTNKVCVAKGSEKDPRSTADKDCEMYDMKMSGNKSSWKMRCNKDGENMTGSGEMTSTPDRNEGKMTFNTAKTGTMSITFVNKRVGGTCDSEEMKKKFDAMQDANNKQVAQQQAMACEGYKRNLGRNVKTYFELKLGAPSMIKTCGIDIDSAKKALCKSVSADNAEFTKQIRGDANYFSKNLQAECPGEMKTYMEVSRKRYCEGRAFTEKQRMSLADCLKGGSSDNESMNTPDPEEPAVPNKQSTATAKKPAAQAGKSEPAKAEPPKDESIKLPGGLSIPGMPGGSSDAVIDGAKKLKNLFGL